MESVCQQHSQQQPLGSEAVGAEVRSRELGVSGQERCAWSWERTAAEERHTASDLIPSATTTLPAPSHTQPPTRRGAHGDAHTVRVGSDGKRAKGGAVRCARPAPRGASQRPMSRAVPLAAVRSHTSAHTAKHDAHALSARRAGPGKEGERGPPKAAAGAGVPRAAPCGRHQAACASACGPRRCQARCSAPSRE